MSKIFDFPLNPSIAELMPLQQIMSIFAATGLRPSEMEDFYSRNTRPEDGKLYHNKLLVFSRPQTPWKMEVLTTSAASLKPYLSNGGEMGYALIYNREKSGKQKEIRWKNNRPTILAISRRCRFPKGQRFREACQRDHEPPFKAIEQYLDGLNLKHFYL